MLDLDIFGNPEPLSIYLVRVDGEVLGCIDNIIDETTASLSVGLNQQYMLEFEVTKDEDSDWYEYIHEGMYLYVKGAGLFKMNQPTMSLDGQTETKTVTAYSCDSELEDKTVTMSVNMGLKTSMEYLVEYEDGETETLINPYTDIPYDWIVLYNTFPEQLADFGDQLEDGHYGDPGQTGWIDVIDDDLISELTDIFTLIPRLKSKVSIDDETGQPVSTEYVITTYDTDDPNKVVMYELSPDLADRIEVLITYYTKYRNQLSLLPLALENAGGAWTLGEIYGLSNGDYSVCNMKYQFDINESIYSFLTNTLAQTINCLVTFDNTTRKVNVTPLEHLGENTGIVIAYDNLVNTLDIATEEERLTTRLKVSGGENLSIARVNFGSDYIDDLGYKLNAVDSKGNRIYVSDSLAEEYTEYIEFREEKREEYIELSKQYEEYTDKISELDNRVPNDGLKNDWGTYSMDELEGSLRTYQNLLAALEVLYKEDYGTVGLNPDGTINEDYIKTTEYWYDYAGYKSIIDEIECAIDVFPYYDNMDEWSDAQKEQYEELIKAWETDWSLYGITELQGKIDTYAQSMDIMLQKQDEGEAGGAGRSAVIKDDEAGEYVIKAWDDLTTEEKAIYGNSHLLYRDEAYNEIYDNWYAAKEYQAGLIDEKNDLQEELDDIQDQRKQIMSDVALENYFSPADCKTLYRLFHDAQYSNENILSTSIDSSSEKIDRMVELLEDAKDQASLVSRPQLTFSVNLDNIMALPEFKPYWRELKPGNYALVQYKDDTYVKLRIIGYKFNPMLPTDEQFELTFSNFVRSRAYYRDWASIFNTSSSSISNSYGSSGGGGGGTFGEGDDIDITISNTMLAKLLNTEAFGSRVAAVIHDTVDAKVLSARLGTFTNARIDNLEADHVSVADLEAANAEIERLDADKASISDLEANYAHITNGVIDNATIDYADINDLNTHYAEIDLANVSNAWIDQGVIRDASISDAKIIGVSANKLTAGTIDASNINVANLRASNLIVDRVNGQPVLGGYTIVSKSSPGYEQMNPAGEGWFEFSNGNFFQTTDTAVDTTKTYYTDGAQVALYDQTYIDGVENTLNERIDGTIETFTGDVVPTLVNYPYTDWYDPTATPPVDNRAEHVGDLYYVINASSDYDGYCYRFAYDNTTHAYSWVLIKDSDVTAALSDISELQTFQSETTTWIEETDEGLTTIRTNQTALEGVVNSTVVSTTQLWFTKANTTAPLAPTSHVTTNNPSTQNTWNISEPEYSSSYPYYYYCYEWEYLDGTYGWSPVVRDIGKGTSQTGVKVWFANANNTNPPSKPTSKVISDSTMGNAWRTVIPAYSSTYPHYYYCYQYEAQDGTLSWSDVVYDGATTKNQEKAPALSQVSTKVNTSTFNELSNTVSENSASITTLSGVVDTKADSSTVETLSNTVNTVSQTATGNSSKISNLTTRLGTNADGTAGQNDIVAKEAALEQDLDGFKTTVSSTYQTKADMDDYSTTTQMESAIEQSAESILSTVSETYTTIDDFTEVQTTVEQTANNVIIKATENDTTAAQGGAHIISSIINVATSGVTIDASKVNIVGVITAINNDTTTTIDGDKITTGTVSASAIDATSGTFSSANIPNLSADKITTGTLDGSLATITNINADNINSGTLNAARLNISDVITAINGDSTTTISGGKITTNSITSTQLAADSVTANEIAANAVTADEIAANAVTADKIMGNTITIGKIDTSDPSTAEAILNSEIDIGSNNFLSNTAEMNTWYAGQAASIEDGVATLTGSSSGWNGRIDTERYDPILYNGTTKYTLSFDYKSTDDCDMVICISSTDASLDDEDYTRTKYTYWRVDPEESGASFTVPDSDDEWVRFVMPYRTIATSDLDQGSGDIASGYLQFYARSDNTTIQLRHIQLERGIIATDWSPATADILSAISGNTDNISTIDEYINGGIIDVSMTSSFSGSEISMDNEDFLEAVSDELGTYHFVYDGTTWNIGLGHEPLTGRIVTFNGGGTNLKSLKVPLTAKQNLNGYDRPWAGGEGKNLLQATLDYLKQKNTTGSWSGNTYTVSGVSYECEFYQGYLVSVKATGTATENASINVCNFLFPANVQYILNGGITGGGGSTWRLYAGSGGSDAYDEGSGSRAFSYDAEGMHGIYIRTYSGATINGTFKPMLRLASIADDTYEPYENICPISGYASAETRVVGKNLFDGISMIRAYTDATNNKITTSYNDVTIFAPCLPNKTYTISKAAGARLSIAYTKEYPEVDVPIYGVLRNNSATSLTITTGSDAMYLVSQVYIEGADTNSLIDILSSVQIEEGSSATTYEAYNASTYQFSFEDAGFVYGGLLDVVKGELSVTHKAIRMGELLWSYESGPSIFYADINDAITPVADGDTTAICSMYSRGNYPSDFGVGKFAVCDSNYTANRMVCVKEDHYSDVKSFTEAVENETLVYELATPKKYKLLRRSQRIPTYIGTNNVWSDVGVAKLEELNGDVVTFNGNKTDIESIELPITHSQDTANPQLTENAQNKFVNSNNMQNWVIGSSGNIASLYKTASGSMNLKSLTTNIVPKQSFNGYGSPWVGGAGKNICNEIHHGNISNTGAYGTGYTRVTNATSATSSTINVSAGSYTISATGLDYCTVLTKDSGGNIVDNYASSWNSLPYTFTITSDSMLYYTCRRSDNASITIANVKIQIESGSSATTWEPYENICPIEGFDSINITRTGKNLFAYPYHDGNTKTSNGITFTANSDGSVICNGTATAHAYFVFRKKGQTSLKPNTSYTISGGYSSTASVRVNVDGVVRTSSGSDYTFTTTDGLMGGDFYIRVDSGTTLNNVEIRPMLRLTSETDSTWESYKGSTYNVSLTSAGTVYGGTLDVVSGQLTVTRIFRQAVASELDSSHWAKGGATNFDEFYMKNTADTYGKTGENYGVENIRCSHAPSLSSASTTQMFTRLANREARIVFPLSMGINSLDAFYAWNQTQIDNNNPLQFCYVLQTPVTYQLTATQVAMLSGAGANYIWTDSGSVSAEMYVNNAEAVLLGGNYMNTEKIDADDVYNGSTLMASAQYLNNSSTISLDVNICATDENTTSESWDLTKYVNWDTLSLPTSDSVYQLNTPALLLSESTLTEGSGDITSGYLQFVNNTSNTKMTFKQGTLCLRSEYACPIAGTDSLSLFRKGKNMVNADEFISDALVKNGENSYTFTKNAQTPLNQRGTGTANVRLEGGKWYTLSFKTSNQSTSGNSVSCRLRVNGIYQSGVTMSYVADGYYVRRINVPSGVDGIQFYYQNNTTAIGDAMTISDIQLEPGYYRTSYESPYYGTYTANLQQNDKSIYGGMFEAISGKMSVTWKSVTIDDSYTVGLSGGRFYINERFDDFVRSSDYRNDILCDRLPSVATYSGSGGVTNNKLGICGHPDTSDYENQNWIYFGTGDANVTTAEQAQEWLANNPLRVIYRAVLPTEYQVAPKKITTLSGHNTIWSDASNVSIRTYVFGNGLRINDNVELETITFSPVTLSNYSIVVTAVPTRGDLIEVGVGESKSIDQRFADSESSIADLNNQYDDMYDEIFDSIDGLSESLSINQEQFRGIVESITDEINRTTSVLNRINTKTAGMDFTPENGLVLYGSEDFQNANYKLQLAAMAINFVYGALGNDKNIIASIVADELTQRVLMNISNVVIGERLMINNFAFIPRTGGNMCLKYLGNVEDEES